MSSRHHHATCLRLARDTVAIALLISTTGCTLWGKDRWSFDRYRDDRAVDIEKRLERSEPIVKSPF